MKDNLKKCKKKMEMEMEDDLKFFVNRRQPKFVFKLKRTSIFLLMEDNL